MSIRIAVLDDSTNVSQRVADWRVLKDADIVVFNDTSKDDAAWQNRAPIRQLD